MEGNPFAPFLANQGTLVLDGGLATALEGLGHDLNDPLWSARVLADRPDTVATVHREYLEAGADCIATATYQATVPGLTASGMEREEAEEVLGLGVRIARRVRDDFVADGLPHGRLPPLVAASVGPYGAYLADGSEYDGRYGLDREALADFHRDRLRVLTDAAPDLVAFETIPSALEAEVLLELSEEVSDVWAWLSFSCADGAHLHDGTPLAEAAASTRGRARLAGVGVNCVEPRHVPESVRVLRSNVDVPVVVYPNSGQVYDAEAKCWTGGFDERAWVEQAIAWRREGARVIGGCCQVGVESIRDLRSALGRAE